jgi:hypothetical protein
MIRGDARRDSRARCDKGLGAGPETRPPALIALQITVVTISRMLRCSSTSSVIGLLIATSQAR